MTARYKWWDGHTESVHVLRVHDGRAFVSWPESRREVHTDTLTPRPAGPDHLVFVVRPAGWVRADRIAWSVTA